jgi:chaperonin GroES
MRLLRSNVLIQLVDMPEKVGSLYIPESERIEGAGKQTHGQVLEAGPGCKLLKKGDWVVYWRYTGKTVDLGDDKMVIVDEGEVLAKIEDYDG